MRAGECTNSYNSIRVRHRSNGLAMAPKSRLVHGNQILQFIAPDDRALLETHMQPASLTFRQKLERPLQRIENVYFPSDAIATVLAVYPRDVHPHKEEVEVGIIGPEGMTGTSLILGADRSPHLTVVQVPGPAHRISAVHFEKCMRDSDTLRPSLLRYANAFSVQTAHTAAANARATLKERLARWLLMLHDRIRGNGVEITHEFLAVMLCVRRAGVTQALHSFQEEELITTGRGRISIVDRSGLEKVAGAFYGKPEAEYRRLLQ